MSSKIEIIKLKLRRGTNAQRKSVILDQGELVSTTDTNRLYVGNGILSGGVSVTSRIHSPVTNIVALTTIPAERNDIVRANNTFYQLTGFNATQISAWANVGPLLDSRYLTYTSNNSISMKLSALSASNIDPSTVSNGLKIESNSLRADINTKSLEISSNKISLKAGGIDQREISSSTFTNGISGGSGLPVGLRVDPLTFNFNSGVLSIFEIPSSSITFSSLDSAWFGDGLIYDGVNSKIKTNITNVDGSSITKDLSGIISIAPGIIPATVYGVLTGNSSLNPTSPLSSIFNGNPQHSIDGAIPGIDVTRFEALSSNGETTIMIELTSAGFATFEGNIITESGEALGRYAIPIFAY
jgi:hypothetical protein